MGVQVEVTSGRTLAIRGTKKIVRRVQRVNATTHSYTMHIQMNASGFLAKRLPVILYEPSGVPRRFKEDIENYPNLHVYWSKSGLMGKEIAKQWMDEVFLGFVEEDSVLILDSWNGYKEMMEMRGITGKRLKIFKLPEKTTSVLQPADVYFNRPFKDFIRKVCNKIRRVQNDYIFAIRKNLLVVLDMLWYQCKAERFKNMLQYSWYRAGYTTEHPPPFEKPAQFCLGYRGYVKCESDSCPKFCFLRCAHCQRHYCFNHILVHRDSHEV